MGKLTVSIGVDEETQESNYQNACLHGVGDLAVSVAVYLPNIPDLTEKQLKEKVEKDFAELVYLGYDVTIVIGKENN